MALKKYVFRVEAASEGARLDQYLAEGLSAKLGRPFSRGKVRTLLQAGAVHLNRGRIKIASKILKENASIEVYLDEARLEKEPEKADRAFTLSPEFIAFEDEWLIAINKPYGLPTQPTLDSSRANLYEILKTYLKERDGPSSYVGLHHRLDRDTSGVILFTKKKEANVGVGEIFKTHTAQKTYLAIVASGTKKLPGSWKVDNFLKKDSGKKSKMRSVRAGGDRALTEFFCIAQRGGFALVEARPKTGRMHQIRVHLSEAGTPILGDRTYGDGESASRLMLHAARLTFPHPISKIQTSIEAPMPGDFLECLKACALPSQSPLGRLT